VSLAVHDLAGRKVRSLISGVVAAGERDVTWDLRDAAGARVADGIYFLRLAVDGGTITRRVAVVH
jgi:flagellar hook assembly protein FlgD